MLAAVQHHDGHAAVGVGEGGAFQRLARGRRQHPLRTRLREAREVPDGGKRTLRVQAVLGRHGQEGRAAEVAHVVGAALLVEQQVPVDPAHRPAVQVVDHRARVALGQFPAAPVRAAFLAALGEQQLLVGPRVVHQLHVVEVVFHVPVEARAPHVLRSLGIAVDDAGALDHGVAVVVPHDHAHVAEPGLVQRGAEVVAHEVAFLLGGVEAGIPALAGLGLVLHRHAPHRHALGLVGLDEAHEALRPGRAAFGQQLAAVVHAAAVLHPGRRAPGRDQQLDRPARHALRGLDHGQQGFAVALDVEAVQRVVAGVLDMGVVAQGEIAAVHVHAAQRVAVALHGVEVLAQQPLLLRRRELLPGGGGGLGEGAAEAFEHLEAARAVHPQPGRCAGMVPGVGARLQRRLRGKPQGLAVAVVACAEHGLERPCGARAAWRLHGQLPRAGQRDQCSPSMRIGGSPVRFSGLPVKLKRSATMKRKFT